MAEPASSRCTITFEAACVERDGRVVLGPLDLRLHEGRIGILGLNGSGKSTLLKLINGLVRTSSGAVCVDDFDPARQPREVRRQVGYLFQNPDNQIVFPVVVEDVEFGPRNMGLPKAEVASRARAALEQLAIGALAERAVSQLSGGEKQLVALAGLLAMEPRTVLYDEPTAQLDLRNRNRVVEAIFALPQQAIIVSHDLELIGACQRVLVLEAGRLVFDGEAEAAVRFYKDCCR